MEHSNKLGRAATYIRMSTGKQIYSIGHQQAALAAYALERGLEITCEYTDAGRSGLTIKRRDALQRLLADVLAADRPFDVILVFDVSRWGRFQDTDESAHYEFLCRRAGVQVHYCSEMFENDGSPTAAILKSLKRVMAGEYSRELSRKVRTAQRRLAAQGHKMGGRPTYGLRRLLVDREGNPRGELGLHQAKNLSSDKVILVPGPPHEVAVVRRIYRLFVVRRLSDRAIATLLNEEGIMPTNAPQWSRAMIRTILTSEQYIGAQVFNKTSLRLRGRRVRNPPEDWVRCDDAFAALIGHGMFEAAQRVRQRQWTRLTRRQMLDALKTLLAKRKKLSRPIIDRSPLTPSSGTYINRFGSLDRAYGLIGYHRHAFGYCSLGRGLESKAAAFVDEVARALGVNGARVSRGPTTKVLLVDGRHIVGATLAAKIQDKRESYWRITRKPAIEVDFLLVAAMDAQAEQAVAYYLFPVDRFQRSNQVVILEGGSRAELYRIDGLDRLYDAVRIWDDYGERQAAELRDGPPVRRGGP